MAWDHRATSSNLGGFLINVMAVIILARLVCLVGLLGRTIRIRYGEALCEKHEGLKQMQESWKGDKLTGVIRQSWKPSPSFSHPEACCQGPKLPCMAPSR